LLIITNETKAQNDDGGKFIPKKAIERGVWFYSGNYAALDNSMINNLLAKNFNTIYFSTVNDGERWDDESKSKNYLKFIDYAHSKGMQVFGVTLEDPTDIFKNEKDLRSEFGKFINNTKNIFDSYMIDVEPHTKTDSFTKKHPPFEENKCMYFNRYINMSKILRNVANEFEVKYIDTIPPWYHEDMKKCGINGGIDALSSNSINLMDYTSTVKDAMNEINSILFEVKKPFVVSIKITRGQGDASLKNQDINKAIYILTTLNSLPIGFYESVTALKLQKNLFTNIHPESSISEFNITKNTTKFTQSINETSAQLTSSVNYITDDDSLLNTKINGIMKVYSTDGTLLKTSSFANGIIVDKSGSISLDTTLLDNTLKNVKIDIVLTDLNKTIQLSNVVTSNVKLDVIQ